MNNTDGDKLEELKSFKDLAEEELQRLVFKQQRLSRIEDFRGLRGPVKALGHPGDAGDAGDAELVGPPKFIGMTGPAGPVGMQGVSGPSGLSEEEVLKLVDQRIKDLITPLAVAVNKLKKLIARNPTEEDRRIAHRKVKEFNDFVNNLDP